jgi:DNA-binding CsgD family transcriptional regulator
MTDSPFRNVRANGARDELLLPIVYSLYRTVYEEDRWPLILRQIQELLSAQACCLCTHDFRRRVGRIAIHSGCFSQDHVSLYNHTYGGRDPWLKHEEHYRTTGIFWIGDELLLPAGLNVTDFHREWMKPQHLAHQCSGVLFRDKEQLVFLRAYRTGWQGAFSRDDLYPLQRLLPHLHQSLELHGVIARSKTGRAKSVTQVLWELEAAESIRQVQNHLLASGIPQDDTAPTMRLKIPETPPAAEDRAPGRELDEEQNPSAISRTVQPTITTPTEPERELPRLASVEERAFIARATDKHGRRWLPVLFNTADEGPQPAPEPATAKPESVTADSTEKPLVTEPNEKNLKQLYNLTPSEAKLAELLASGTDLPSAALQLRVGLNTVRTHLQRIYSKTDTHHQSELVALLLAGPARLRVEYYRKEEKLDTQSRRQ